MAEMVKVYDFKTKQVTTIPMKELAPGMVLANAVGIGDVWIDANDGKQSHSGAGSY